MFPIGIMRLNLPVTQREYDFPAANLLVSTTDAQGRITHCNQAFVQVSGYSYEGLIGQPHNLIRHPDMPEEAFKDMWATIGRGRPWTGIVKNRRIDGDHYWVEANVTPIVENGKPVGYMSVRFKPTREQVRAAQALYADVVAERQRSRPRFRLHAGHVRPEGWRDTLGKLHRLTLTQRLAIGLSSMVALPLLAGSAGWMSPGVAFGQAAALLVLAAVLLGWFRIRVMTALDEVDRFAGDLASCNLTTQLQREHPHALTSLMRRIWQIQVNLRAVIGDVRTSVNDFSTATHDIASGSVDLSQRTEAQAADLEKTAAAMEEIAGAVRQSAETARNVAAQSDASQREAVQGGQAVGHAHATMHEIKTSSIQVESIISMIESIAFQTNILALNAAVEAARAGDQGRGFAVVATEVRALAQRSANAAKEIRELIGNSARQIEAGAQHMEAARTTIDGLVRSVEQVTQLMRQITHASAEQSSGIAEVNRAVSTLESTTQQNAALVEESAASVAVLSQRTDTLARTVQVFRLATR